MRILVTGSAGHLGEALVRTLRADGHDVVGLDLRESPFTDEVGSIADRVTVARCMPGIEGVLHTAALHKPHVATHARQRFVDTNVTGTLNLLEEASRVGVGAFVLTSSTSAFGRALTPGPGEPAAWIQEQVASVPRNIYGVTKVAAEDLGELFARNRALPCLILRTSRFFPEEDDRKEVRDAYEDGNVKANEFLYRRVELEDAVAAHHLALERAARVGFGRFIVSATTPFAAEDLRELRENAPAVVRRLFPEYPAEYARRGWSMFPTIERVYVNTKAREVLDWRPRFDFGSVLQRLSRGEPPQSDLARAVGKKGYHEGRFAGGLYPVE